MFFSSVFAITERRDMDLYDEPLRTELFGEIIHNIFGCGCYFVVECYGSVDCGWKCSVG